MIRPDLRKPAIVFAFLGTIYYAFTNTIYSIPITAPLLSWLPIGYWAIIAITFLLTATTIMKETLSATDYLVVSLLLLVLFIGPELMEYSVRVRDSYSFLYLSNYVTSPALYNQTSYSQYNYLPNWPGFFYFVSMFYQVLGIGYYAGAKIIFVAGQTIILLLSFALGRIIFGSKRGSVLAGLFVVLLGWDVWTNPSPVLFGAVFLVSLLLVILAHGGLGTKMFMLTLLYSAVTLTHGLTAVLFLPLLILIFLFPLARRHFGNLSSLTRFRSYFARHVFTVPIRANAAFVILAGSVFTFWFVLAPTAINRGNILSALNFILHLNETPLLSQVSNITAFRYPAVITAAVFLVLLSSFIVVAIFGSFKGYGLLSLQSFALLIGAVGFTYLFFPTSQDFYDRIFEDGFPFLVWILVAGTIKFPRKKIYVLMILVMLASGFVAAYSHESVLIYPPTENVGDSYLLHYSVPRAVVAYLTDGPTAQGISDAPAAPIMLELTSSRTIDVQYLTTSNTIISSDVVQFGLLYYYGCNFVNEYLGSHQVIKVYDSGPYAIYQNPT